MTNAFIISRDESRAVAEDLRPPSPTLLDNRFYGPLCRFGHQAFPLEPLGEQPIGDPNILVQDDEKLELASFWDQTCYNVGLICGAASQVTVLEVSQQGAQDWYDEQDFPETPCFWTRRARYYLFSPLPDAANRQSKALRSGLRLVPDGEWVVYAGSMYEDGRTTYWETSPDDVELAEVPAELLEVPSTGAQIDTA